MSPIPSTTPDNFPYEGPPQVAEDLGRTLHGGLSGTEPILAEVVQSKVITTDASLSDLAARVTALENGTGGVGWIPIQSGNDSGTSFTVDLTDGGRFPDPPLWSMVQVFMRFDLSDLEFLSMRINGDSSSIYRSAVVPITADGAFGGSPEHLSGSSRWAIGRGATVSTNNLQLLLFHTASNPGLLNFQATSTRQSDNSSVHTEFSAWGSLDSALTASSLSFFLGASPASGESFTNAWWWATGLRMTAP